MSEQAWYYEKDGQQSGPVDEQSLKSMVASGEITEATRVWRDGIPDWVPFRDTILSDAPPNLPTAVPPPAPANFVPRDIKFNENYTFGVTEVLGQAWNVMVANFWPLVGFYFLVNMILSFVGSFGITIFFLTYPCMAGYMYFALKNIRGDKSGDIECIFDGFKRNFGSLAILSAFLLIPVVVIMIPIFVIPIAAVFLTEADGEPSGMMAIILGGVILLTCLLGFFLFVYWGFALHFASILCLDSNMQWKEALALGQKATKKRFLSLIGFSIVCAILSIAGLLALYVGIFVASAWTAIASVCIYEKAFGENRTA